jgi:hypothetical protein
MIRFIKNILLKIYITLNIWLMRLGIAMKNSEDDIMTSGVLDNDEKGKIQIRQTHRNPVIEKMLQGERDEQYVKDYYEILRKADTFLKTASPEKIAMAADKYGVASYGKKDRWGRRFEHFGFFDPKHKNYGMTLSEAMEQEVKDKTTKDDVYPIEFMFDNTPITVGFSSFRDMKESDKVGSGYEVMNPAEKAKASKFPMTVIRKNNNAFNKIEMLTSSLHIKKIRDRDRLLEFFIPKKYKLGEHLNNKELFDELIDIDQVWIKDEYDGRYGFTINGYYKYLDYDDNFDVLKFNGYRIRNLDKNE